MIPADAVVCAVPNSNLAGLLDELPEHDEIYAAADKLGYTPIVSTNLYLDRPLGTASAFEGLIGGTGIIDEVFDRQIMHGRSTDRGWLYCLTTSGAYEQIHRAGDEIVAEQMALLRRYYPAANDAEVLRGAGGQDAEGHLLPGRRHGFAAPAAADLGAHSGVGRRLDRHGLVGHHGERRSKCLQGSRITARASLARR